ncbi:MAG: 4Fe-4S dicluster domain-containing protein [Desulfobacterales bacterium]
MNENPPVNVEEIREQLDARKDKMKMALRVCAHCSLCAESCFLFHVHDGDPRYMPSHKFINSIGRLYKKKGRVSREDLEEIKEIVWRRCVLCTRCYCPLGIDIPEMIALARNICRSQDVVYTWDEAWSVPAAQD